LTVTALDRANAEDALLPVPKVFDSHVDDLFTSGTADSMEIDGTYTLYHFSCYC
jgi:hypothetical protein